MNVTRTERHEIHCRKSSLLLKKILYGSLVGVDMVDVAAQGDCLVKKVVDVDSLTAQAQVVITGGLAGRRRTCDM